MTNEKAIEILRYSVCPDSTGRDCGKYTCSECKTAHDMAIKALKNSWILCDEKMPEEHESIFAKLYDTDKWMPSMFKKCSDQVITTLKCPSGELITSFGYTADGKWESNILTKSFLDCEVIAWIPLPKPYKPESEDQINESV